MIVTARNYLRQFAAWGTGFWVEFFKQTRTRITANFAFTVIAIATVFYFVGLWYQKRSVSNTLASFFDDPVLRAQVINQMMSELYTLSTVLYLLAVPIICIIAYVIIGRLLKPIYEALQIQKRFIAGASHELRTPLSVIKTNAEVFLMSKVEETSVEETRRIVRVILEEINRMTDILKNLLDLSRLEQRDTKITFTFLSVPHLIQDSITKVFYLLERKHVSVKTKYIQPVKVWGNEAAMEEVIINLLKNAISYTPPHKIIMMWTQVDKKTIRINVKDQGIGIPEKDLPYIFEPFYRAENIRRNPTTALRGSSGLGLTIVRDIIRKHRGDISIDSKEGKGTLVTVTLPIAAT